MKVIYIRYKSNKRTTIKADTEYKGLVYKQEVIRPIQQAVVEQELYTEQEYMDYLTNRMLARIHDNHMLNKTW